MDYKVRIVQGGLSISPPIRVEDEDRSIVLLVDSRHGDVVSIVNEFGAIQALYDELQVNSALKDGDTFTLAGKSKPFAKVQGVDVIPLYALRGYK